VAMHTRSRNDATRKLVSVRNGRRVVFGVVPLPIAIGLTAIGGVALAAVLLTTSIGGTLTVRNVGTSNSITVTGSSQDGSALDCGDIRIGADAKTLAINPILTKTQNGANSDQPQPILGGECTITLNVKNTGTNPIKVDQGQTAFGTPTGITLKSLNGSAFDSIAPGQTGQIVAVLNADSSADGSGNFGGRLVYTDA
jgi:archaellum component FlaG (FlaF/FlaG flagellin family)